MLDKLRKYCYKSTHTLQLSQSCEQEVSRSDWTNNVNNFINKAHRFSLVTSKISLVSASKKFLGRSQILSVSDVSFLLSFYSFYPFLFQPLGSYQPKPFFRYPVRSKKSQHFCKQIKGKVNLYNISSIQYMYV